MTKDEFQKIFKDALDSGMTAEEIAKKIDVNPTSPGRWAIGKRIPEQESIRQSHVDNLRRKVET